MRPGFSFLVCPDSALLKEQLEKQLADAATWKRLIFWGDEEAGDPFWDSLSQVGLFGEKRAVIVRQAENWPSRTWNELSIALSRKNDQVWPFFCLEVGTEKAGANKGKFKIPACIQKARCFAFADKKGWVWRSPGLGQNLQKFVREHAKSLGLTFSQEDIASFCASCSRDAYAVTNELNKLSLLAEDGRVKPEMLVDAGLNQEQNAYDVSKELFSGNLSAAWQSIAADPEGSLLFPLIGALARDLRILWQIKAGEEPYLKAAEAGFKRKLARNLDAKIIAYAFAALADAEWQVKSGRRTPGQTLASLGVALSELFRAAGKS